MSCEAFIVDSAQAAAEKVVFIVSTLGISKDVTVRIHGVSAVGEFVEGLRTFDSGSIKHLSDYERCCTEAASFTFPNPFDPNDSQYRAAFTTENYCTLVVFGDKGDTEDEEIVIKIQTASRKRKSVPASENRAEKMIKFLLADIVAGGNTYNSWSDAFKYGKEDAFIEARLCLLMESFGPACKTQFAEFLAAYPRFVVHTDSQ